MHSAMVQAKIKIIRAGLTAAVSKGDKELLAYWLETLARTPDISDDAKADIRREFEVSP
jgi:hypothetical protein